MDRVVTWIKTKDAPTYYLIKQILKTEIGNDCTKINAISKWEKVAIPDWRQMKVLSKGFQMVNLANDCL